MVNVEIGRSAKRKLFSWYFQISGENAKFQLNEIIIFMYNLVWSALKLPLTNIIYKHNPRISKIKMGVFLNYKLGSIKPG